MGGFEDVIKIGLIFIVALGIPSGLYLGFRAAMATIRQMEREQVGPELEERTIAELERMRRELAELHERMDFAERLLAQRPESARLEG